jgi:hypothetical protein
MLAVWLKPRVFEPGFDFGDDLVDRGVIRKVSMPVSISAIWMCMKTRVQNPSKIQGPLDDWLCGHVFDYNVDLWLRLG